MKVSYRTYPFLKKISDGSAQCDGRIRAITRPYFVAMVNAGGKLGDIIEKNRTFADGASGAFMLASEARHTIVFHVYGDHMAWQLWIGDWLVFKSDPRIGLLWGSPDVSDAKILLAEAKVYHQICWELLAFERYADLEVKELNPGQRIAEIGCKYINETAVPVTIMDSTWFTTLVKSDAFKVSGHFRLQACGEGMKDHKLIWINDHMKSGYTSHAKKLVNDAEPIR